MNSKSLDSEEKWKTTLKNMEWCNYCCWYDRSNEKCSIIDCHPDDFGDEKTLSHTALCYLNWQLNKKLHDIKSACEFYLKYKDKPELFRKEQPQYLDDFCNGVISKIVLNTETKTKDIIPKYNEWLFKLAFKEVTL